MIDDRHPNVRVFLRLALDEAITRSVPGPDLDAKEAYHGFANGVLFTGSKGQLVADYGRHKLLPEEQFKDFTAPKQTIAPSIGHHKEWIEAIKGNGATLCRRHHRIVVAAGATG